MNKKIELNKFRITCILLLLKPFIHLKEAHTEKMLASISHLDVGTTFLNNVYTYFVCCLRCFQWYRRIDIKINVLQLDNKCFDFTPRIPLTRNYYTEITSKKISFKTKIQCFWWNSLGYEITGQGIFTDYLCLNFFCSFVCLYF